MGFPVFDALPGKGFMSDITFLCPHCDQMMETTDDMAGTEIDCPACGKPLRIPRLAPAPERREPAAKPVRKTVVRPRNTVALAPHKSVDMVRISRKGRTTTAVLCFFFGILGIHRFYTGKPGTGLAQMLSLGGLGIWWLADFITILLGLFRDGKGLVIFRW